jgi:hypothetical protein
MRVMWVVGLSLSVSPPTIPCIHAAAAARRFRGHRVLCVSFRDSLGSWAARTVEYLKYSSSGSSHEVLSKTTPPSTSAAASRFQIRRPVEEAANLFPRCRPCRFSRLRRVRPQTTLWACCIPLPTLGFAWLRADRQRLRCRPTVPTGAIPSGAFPFRPGGHRHRAIADSFTVCPAPLVVGLLPSCMTAEAVLHFERRPHLRGFPAGSPLLTRRVAATGSPDAPLGFSPTLGFHPSTLLATRIGRSHSHSVRVPTEAGPLQTAHPPKRTCDSNKTVAFEPSGCHFHRLRGRHRNPGSQSRARGFPCAPSMPKHLAGATAFRGSSLPMCRVTAETHSSFRSERPLARIR